MAGPQLILMFDDGNAKEHDQYLSVVREREVPFSLAIPTERLGSDGNLTVDQLHELVEAGCEVVAHGRRHRYLQAHRLAVDVDAGDSAVPVASDHVFPGESHGVLPGDEFEVTDGEHAETRVIDSVVEGEDCPELRFESPLGASYSDGLVRPAPAQLQDEIKGAGAVLAEHGFDPQAYAFPYDAADVRAWQRAREHYDVLVDAATRSLPNPPGTPLTELRRFYFETNLLTRVEIGEYLDAIVATDGLGVLAGHTHFESVTPERVSFVIDAARERGVELTTVSDAASADGAVAGKQ